MKENFIWLNCKCNSCDHAIQIYADPTYPEVYLNFKLNHMLVWYQRIWPGIKYIFGKTTHSEMFDWTILGKKEINKLKEILDECE